MKYKIFAQSFDRVTGKTTAKSRSEIIDQTTNALFWGYKDITSIKKAYEAFWNDMNPNSTDVVFVSKVKIIK